MTWTEDDTGPGWSIHEPTEGFESSASAQLITTTVSRVEAYRLHDGSNGHIIWPLIAEV